MQEEQGEWWGWGWRGWRNEEGGWFHR